MLSPLPARMTLWSPGTDPPRNAAKPIAPRARAPVAPSRPPGMPAVIQPFLAPAEALADAAAWQSAGRRLAEDPHGYRTEALTA